MSYLYLVLFTATGGLLAIGGMLASRLLAPRNPTPEKLSPYECGGKTMGASWMQFKISYYLFALVFLVFEVETAFLFPCAVVLRDLGAAALFEISIFAAILALGLLYAWRKGVLEWM